MEGDFHTAAIIGLGLMGGSLARELSRRGTRVSGWDREPATVQAAVDAGVVAESLDETLSGLRKSDLVVFAVPVTEAFTLLDKAKDHLHSAKLVTDVGSTKGSITDAAESLGIGPRFVGSHPLAGDHRSGFEASRSGMFTGTRVYLCPSPSAERAAMESAVRLWSDLGAHTEVVDADDHDRRMAWVSHLPQLSSTALANVLRGEGFSPDDLGPGGRDVTRLAGSSAEIWTAICLDNSPAVARAVRSLLAQLGEIEEALEKRDAVVIRRFFDRSPAWRVHS